MHLLFAAGVKVTADDLERATKGQVFSYGMMGINYPAREIVKQDDPVRIMFSPGPEDGENEGENRTRFVRLL